MAEKIDAIKEELTATPTEALEAFVEKYASDSRTGVQKLVDTAKKRMDKLQKEMIRTENLKKYEKEYDTYTYICGIDEVGRGPLAGPVVAGAVILPKDCDILYINDSKKLSAAKREELYDIIMEQAVATGLGTIGPDRIDEINILQASLEAMKQAFLESAPIALPGIVLIDGNKKLKYESAHHEMHAVVEGDAKSLFIGLASIAAKEYRDQLMKDLGSRYPGYGWEQNAGYPTKMHLEAITTLVVTELHRLTFKGVKEVYAERGYRGV
jgi:ribonuclease HII